MAFNLLRFVKNPKQIVFALFIFTITLIIPVFQKQTIAHIRIEWILFAFTLAGIAIFNKTSFLIAIAGLFGICLFKYIHFDSFSLTEHLFGKINFIQQITDRDNIEGKWFELLNIFGLLLGFAILSHIFEDSAFPKLIPRFIPSNFFGAFILLCIIFILSAFIDNIAAALIGASIAHSVYKGKVHISYLVAIVAASNAGGAGSVIGDTTTTMMWIQGVNPVKLTAAWIGAFIAFGICAIFAAQIQAKFSSMLKSEKLKIKIKWNYIVLCISGLVAGILTNLYFGFPALGIWLVFLAGSFLMYVPWKVVNNAFKGAIFLVALILCASLMPIHELPVPAITTTFGLGIVSAVFDNIPLTALSLQQGGYDWAFLAFAVGFGGTITWFGSSAGVAITNMFPESRSLWEWIKNGWFVLPAYVIAFMIMFYLREWMPF